jgi:hypothetical protein
MNTQKQNEILDSLDACRIKILEEELKTEISRSVDYFNALEYLHNAIEDDSGDLNLALARSRRIIKSAL